MANKIPLTATSYAPRNLPDDAFLLTFAGFLVSPLVSLYPVLAQVMWQKESASSRAPTGNVSSRSLL